MGSASPSRAEIFAALAQQLDLSVVCGRFGLSREQLASLFQEAAALFQKQEASTRRPSVKGTPSTQRPSPSAPKGDTWRCCCLLSHR